MKVSMEGSIYSLTLRDWFAAQALAGIITSNGPTASAVVQVTDARNAYAYADAMLAARTEGETK